MAACACMLHDYGRVVTERHKGHAEAGYEPMKEFLRELDVFTNSEIEKIALCVKEHSNKAEIGDPLVEIVKDADLLDFHQYGAGKVVTIEIDGNLIEILSETLAGFDNVKVVAGNILKTDVQKLIAEEGGATLQEGDGRKQRRYENVKIIGNLPYYITTGIIMKLLEERLPVKSITIMMQKEVADRIKSGPGSRTYGAISVAVQ